MLDAFFFLFLCSPVVALVLCGWVVMTDHLRPVSGVAISLAVVDGVAFFSYWTLWGEAFDVVDAGGHVPLASRLGMNVAWWVGVAALAGLVGLVGVRTLRGAADPDRHETVE